MVRKLRYHEQKLLKKVDFINWEADNNLHEVKVMRKYSLTREDYTKYNKLSRLVREIARKLNDLDSKDTFRIDQTAKYMQKLYNMGLIPGRDNLELCDKVCASSFCRRRLPVVMSKSSMAESIRVATQFVEQGHVRVGPEMVTDPAFIVTRNMEDFVTWVNSSTIRKHVMEYNEIQDDFEM